jgi:dipeptidase E
MSYFYAIGGANYDKKESLDIDLDFIKESGKTNPIILFISAANNDDINKINTFKEYFNSLGADVRVLTSKITDKYNLRQMFDEADIIYIGGGITSRLYDYAIKVKLKELLLEAYHNNKIIVGVSAGAILFFDYGYGDKDSYTYNLETKNHKITNGLGIFNGVFCPHYQNNGLLEFHEEIKKFNLNGFALENGSALKINNNGFVVIKQKGCSAFMFDNNENHKLVYLNNHFEYNYLKLY